MQAPKADAFHVLAALVDMPRATNTIHDLRALLPAQWIRFDVD